MEWTGSRAAEGMYRCLPKECQDEVDEEIGPAISDDGDTDRRD